MVGTWSRSSGVVWIVRLVPVVNSGASKMILPAVIVFFLSAVLAESLHEGDSCDLTSSSRGVCTLLENCAPVFENLKLGNTPDLVCGYSRFTPIVCCPISSKSPLPVNLEDGRGAIAKQKCAEYSQYVYALKQPPTFSGTKQLRNVSECGIKSHLWIGNNRNALPREFPHMAAVGYDLKTGDIGWYCGGTLISETFVLTAARCTYSSKWGDATWVRVGDVDLEQSDDLASPVDRHVTERIRHPDFKPSLQYHDIALLRLDARVPFNGWIRPACLHTASLTGTQKAIVTGWGRPEDNDDVDSRRVRMAILPLVDPQTCNANWTSGTVNTKLPNGVVGNWSICTEAEDKDSCQTEAGGPLVIYSRKFVCMYDVVGVTSEEKLCNDKKPGIYARVHYYVQWIESIVWGKG